MKLLNMKDKIYFGVFATVLATQVSVMLFQPPSFGLISLGLAMVFGLYTIAHDE